MSLWSAKVKSPTNELLKFRTFYKEFIEANYWLSFADRFVIDESTYQQRVTIEPREINGVIKWVCKRGFFALTHKTVSLQEDGGWTVEHINRDFNLDKGIYFDDKNELLFFYLFLKQAKLLYP